MKLLINPSPLILLYRSSTPRRGEEERLSPALFRVRLQLLAPSKGMSGEEGQKVVVFGEERMLY
jgi:hypothetical protein